MPSRERRRRRHVLTLKCPAPAGELARNLLHLDSLHEGAEVRPGAQGEMEVWSYGEQNFAAPVTYQPPTTTMTSPTGTP